MNSRKDKNPQRILWLTNISIPLVDKLTGKVTTGSGLWMKQVSESLYHQEGCQMFFICPSFSREFHRGSGERIQFCEYPKKFLNNLGSLRKLFRLIIKEFKPDIIHIWGTEYLHSLAMAYECQDLGLLERTILDIQGVTKIISRDFTIGLPRSVVYGFTLRDLIRRDNVLLQQLTFFRKSKHEEELIKIVKHVFGRTEFDNSYVKYVNPAITYHHSNRVLRNAFYSSHKWSKKSHQPRCIFLAQAHYPIKGMHILLEALSFLLPKYPDIQLIVSGSNLMNKQTLKGKLKWTRYIKYLNQLIKGYKLSEHIIFTGSLSEEEIIQQYLRSAVFVSPSLVENLSNATMEAMYLGVPVVSSDVGGINDLITHNVNGYLYPATNPYLLAYRIDQLFMFGADPNLTRSAIIKAETVCNQVNNLTRINEVYNLLCSESKV